MQFKLIAAVFAAVLSVAAAGPVPAPVAEVAERNDCWPFHESECN
jgi:hypothetical protein